MGLSSLHYPFPVESDFLERWTTQTTIRSLCVYVDSSTLCAWLAWGLKWLKHLIFFGESVTKTNLNHHNQNGGYERPSPRKGFSLKVPVSAVKTVSDNEENIFQKYRRAGGQGPSSSCSLPSHLLECFVICCYWNLALPPAEKVNTVHVIQYLRLY